MPSYYRDYNQYLGATKCCDLRGQGPIGPQGPTGPAGIGPVGPTGPSAVNPFITQLTISGNSITIPEQPFIGCYSLVLSNNTLGSITFTSFPVAAQAIIYIYGAPSTSNSINNNISINIPGVSSTVYYCNYNTTPTIPSLTQPAGILMLRNAGQSPSGATAIFGDLTLYYQNP